MDCGQPIDLEDFPDFVKVEHARRCAGCTARALWHREPNLVI